MMYMPGKPPAVMGIVNVTPDSFFNGGRYATVDAATEHGMRLADEGADILDIGGASSRPGAADVPAEEEAGRVVPVIARLAKEFKGPVSVDTTWSSVARKALDAGAAWVNDISAGRRDAGMFSLADEYGCTMLLMHSRGTPGTMRNLTGYSDIVKEVRAELCESVERCIAAGVAKERIVIDPGIGFAKTAAQNIALLRSLDVFAGMGYPVAVGVSRKSFIGRIIGKTSPEERLAGTLGSVASAFLRGAAIFRVHDVAATKDFLKVLSAIECGAGVESMDN